MSADPGPDYTFIRCLGWIFVLFGFELIAGGIGWFAGPGAGLIAGGFFLIAWSLITLALIRGKT